MRNISISQCIIIIIIGAFLFSDFSKIIKNFCSPAKNSKIYKNLKKK